MANMFINAITDIWTSGGTTYNAIKMTVTNSASAAGSKILNLLVAPSTSVFSVDIAGNTTAAGTLTATGTVTGGAFTTTGALTVGSSVVQATDTPTVLYIRRNDTVSPAAGETLGYLNFQGEDSAGSLVTYASFIGFSSTTTDGNETGYANYATVKNGGALTNRGTFGSDAIYPTTDDGLTLGTTTNRFSDLFLSTAGTISFASTNWVATHTSGILTVGTGDLRITTAGTNSASVVTVGGTQTLTGKTLTSPTINGGVINNTTIGGVTPEAISATSLTATSIVGSGTFENVGTVTFDGDLWFGAGYSTAVNYTGAKYNASLGSIGIAGNTAPPLSLNRSESGTANLACMVVCRNGTTLNAILATPTVVQFSTSSDYRLKENVTEMTDVLTRLDALRPINFTWISDPGAGIADGFLAHEVQLIVPAAVYGEKDGEEMQGVDLSKLVPLLVGANKELLAMVNDLTARIAALEGV